MGNSGYRATRVSGQCDKVLIEVRLAERITEEASDGAILMDGTPLSEG